MRYYQLRREERSTLAVTDGSAAYDLTSVKAELDTFESLVRTATITDRSPDEVVAPLLERADTLTNEELRAHRTLPLDVDEVWAAGVTYQISEEARTEESSLPEMYLDVYDADRPEIFFKSTPNRTVGPDGAVGIRADSEWDVPEPELGVVLYRGETVGYTVGNDMSSRSIEGENPLYLPQAKLYDRCCSLGPCVVTADAIEDPHDLRMSMTITRDDVVVYEGATSTAEMKRSCNELVSYLTRHNAVPEVAVLLTGTSLVPDDGFTLQSDDVVEITIEDIGTLRNHVTVV